MDKHATIHTQQMKIPLEDGGIIGDLTLTPDAQALVIFAHGSGSGRMSPRNRSVAQLLQRNGLGTLLVDLLTVDEQAIDEQTGELRFDIDLLCRRLGAAILWAGQNEQTKHLKIALYGASTGAAAALMAAAEHPDNVFAVVSRGGRTDLAGDSIANVKAPVLMIVGGDDRIVLDLNSITSASLRVEHNIEIIPNATHLFEEPGALERAAELTCQWLLGHL